MPKSKAVAVVPTTEQFPMIINENNEAFNTLVMNLENKTITRREMFTVIPNPKGEAEWTIKLPTGKQFFEELDAIILHIGNERTFYEAAYGTTDAAPPDCSSENGVIGKGAPGGKCIDCDLAKFGPNSEAPRCSQKRPIYMIVPAINPNMPIVLNATGPSFPNIKKFNLELMHFGVNVYDIKVKLTLEVKKTKNNMEASVLNLESDGDIRTLDPEGYEKLIAYRNSLLPYINPDFQRIQEAAGE